MTLIAIQMAVISLRRFGTSWEYHFGLKKYIKEKIVSDDLKIGDEVHILERRKVKRGKIKLIKKA